MTLEDVRYEWAKGPYRLSVEDSRLVMDRLAEVEALLRVLTAHNCSTNLVREEPGSLATNPSPPEAHPVTTGGTL